MFAVVNYYSTTHEPCYDMACALSRYTQIQDFMLETVP